MTKHHQHLVCGSAQPTQTKNPARKAEPLRAGDPTDVEEGQVQDPQHSSAGCAAAVPRRYRTSGSPVQLAWFPRQPPLC